MWILKLFLILNFLISIVACEKNNSRSKNPAKYLSSKVTPQKVSNKPEKSFPEVIEGSEKTKQSMLDGYMVLESSKYWVVIKELDDNVGSKIFVQKKPKDKKNLIQDLAKSDFHNKDAEAEYFYGIMNDFIFIDMGTSVEPRLLRIINLSQNNKVFEETCSSPVKLLSEEKLSFWSEDQKKEKKFKCLKEKEWTEQGLGTIFEQRVELNLKTFKLKKSSDRRCSPLQ